MQNNSEHPRRFTDERLAQELAFAASFDDPMPEAQAWLAALMAEREHRSDLGVLHRAGLGMFRPTASKTVVRVDRLISAGLLARNPQTGIVFLTDAGNAVLGSPGHE